MVSGIPDPLSWLPDSKADDSRIFHKKKFPRFRNTDLTLRGINRGTQRQFSEHIAVRKTIWDLEFSEHLL